MGCVDSRVEDSYLDSGACIALAADGTPEDGCSDECG